MKRKVCIVVASRANYGRVKYLMAAVQKHPELELQLIVGASLLLYRFGKAVDIIRADGFEPVRKIHYVVEGETLVTQAKSAGLGIIELSGTFEELAPDIVVTVADRFETIATAIAASYMNIPLAHLQGGEVSGNIDEKVRHAITKFADIHFPATEASRERLIGMGEDPEMVFNFGCPAMDILVHEDLSISNDKMMRYGGIGTVIDWSKPYILIVQHPVTTSYGQGLAQITSTLNAMLELRDFQKVVLWPNIDAGSDDVSKGIRVFRERHMQENFHYFRNFSPEDYACVLNNASCLVGNSSSFIREGSFLGVPAVIVGERQSSREHGRNITMSSYNSEEIRERTLSQIQHGKFKRDLLFGDGTAGKRIADKLSDIKLSIKKTMTF